MNNVLETNYSFNGNLIIKEEKRGYLIINTGFQGNPGKDAKINGLNTISIVDGLNTTVSQEGSELSIGVDLSNLQPKETGKGLSETNVTAALKTAYDQAVLDKHTHSNKTDLDLVRGTNTGDQVLPTKVSDLINDTGFITISTVNTHNTSETSHNDLRQDINEARSIAEGKARGIPFATEAALDAWLAIPENVATLNIGDNLYIEEVDVPDYWWNGTEKKILEGEKPDFTPYYTKEEADAQFVEAEVGKRLITDIEAITFNDKVGKTDYATNSVGGVIKTGVNGVGINTGNLYATSYNYAQYQSSSNNIFIGKATLENVLSEKLSYYQIKNTLDNPLMLGTIYDLGELAANLSINLPTAVSGRKIKVKFKCGSTAYTFAIASGTTTTYSLTLVANTVYDIEFEANAAGVWVPNEMISAA